MEDELEEVSQFLLEWHKNRSSTGRSFLMYTEEMTAERFTQLAHWLGRPCTFGSVPNANELDASQGKMSYFHSSSEPVDVTCVPGQISEPTYQSSDGQTRVLTDAAPEALPEDQHTFAYETLIHEHDNQCTVLESLPHNQACAPLKLSQARVEQPQNDLVKQAALSELGVDLFSDRKESYIDHNLMPKFYIHEDGPFNFTDSVQCLMDKVGLNKDVDAFDDRLVPDLAEHMADWWLLERFRRHPARVYSPDEAQLHVIGTAFTTAYRAHRTHLLARCTVCTPQSTSLSHLSHTHLHLHLHLRLHLDLSAPCENHRVKLTATADCTGGFIWKRVKTDAHGPLGCGDTKQYYKRTKALAKYLRTESPWWKQHKGRDFLVLNSFYWLKDAVGIEMMNTLLKGPAIFTSSDKDYVDFEAINNTVIPFIIPYKAHYRLEDAAWLALEGRSRDPKNTLMFHGSTTRGTRRGYTEGELRQEICNRLGPAVKHTDLRCVSTTWMAATALHAEEVNSPSAEDAAADGTLATALAAHMDEAASSSGQKKLSEEGYRVWIEPEGRKADPKTLRGYTNAKICLVPAGDTPTSRRLFDAMAAGCVPLLLTPYEDIIRNLPFPRAIDWSDTVLFGGGLTCSMRDRLEETIQWIQELLKPENAQKLDCMGRRAQRTFAKYLSFRDEGVVSGLLHELKHDGRYHKSLAEERKMATEQEQPLATIFAPLTAGGMRASAFQPTIALPSTPSSCDTKDQCGCLGTATTTFYIRYHKTGCVLTRKIMDEIDAQCGIHSHSVQANMSGDTPATILGANDLAGNRCNNLKVALDGNNLINYPDEVLKNLTRPREGVRFVHMLREPLRLVASYYAFHAEGKIGGENDPERWRSLQHNLTQMSLAEGIAVIAKLVAEEQLPAMAKVHDQLVQSGREDVLEMRMEEFEANFNGTIGALLAHAGMSARCAAEGQPLFKAIAKHDVSRFSAEQLANDNHIQHIPVQSPSMDDGSGPTLEDRALHELLTGNKALRASLRDFGKRLGYSYPEDRPDDTFKEAEARQSASDKLVKAAASAALGNDNGTSHDDDLFSAFSGLLQGSQRLRPRIMHLSGCSESSAVMRTGADVLALHGIHVDPELPMELLKPDKNPVTLTWAEQGKSTSVDQAFEVMAARAAKHGKTLFIKDGRAASLSFKTLQNVGAYSTRAFRANFLDYLVCEVRDCFGSAATAGVAVNASTGNRSSWCFSRRSLPRTDQPKALLNTSDLIHELKIRKQYARKDLQNMKTNPFTSEQLLEFEVSDSNDSVERSLQEWKRLMHKLGVVDFNDDGVRKLLNSHRGEHPQSLHSDTILNVDEVAATLKGTEFEHLLRLGPDRQRPLTAREAVGLDPLPLSNEAPDASTGLRDLMKTKGSHDSCLALLKDHASDLVVLPEAGLLWCPTAKAGTTSMLAVLPKLVKPKEGSSSLRPAEQSSAEVNGATSLRERFEGYDPRAPLHRILKHLRPSDAWRVMMASDLNTTAQHDLCTSGRALSFTTVRNPWERLVSAYLGKIADGSKQAPGVSATPIREKFGMGAEEPISFSRFVRYVADEPDETINVHFLPQSTRCGAGLGRYVIESRIETSFANDVKLMLRAIGKSEDLFQEEHISSAGKCLASEACTANLEEQIGPKATWRRDGTSEIARKLYESDPEYDLVEMVRQRYSDDTSLLGYSYPPPPAENTSL